MLIWKEKREDYSKVKLQPFVLVFFHVKFMTMIC